MSTDKATPRPWTIISDEKGEVLGISDKNNGWVTSFEHDITRLDAELIVKTVNCHEELVKALQEISKGLGRYSKDHLEHAKNTIEDMKELANQALAKVKEEK